MGYKYTDNKKLGEFSCTERAEIKKHSENIIDLIEVGDYVNGKYVFDVFVNFEIGKKKAIKVDCMRGYIYENEIGEIVTHEQFNSIKYEV